MNAINRSLVASLCGFLAVAGLAEASDPPVFISHYKPMGCSLSNLGGALSIPNYTLFNTTGTTLKAGTKLSITFYKSQGPNTGMSHILPTDLPNGGKVGGIAPSFSTKCTVSYVNGLVLIPTPQFSKPPNTR